MKRSDRKLIKIKTIKKAAVVLVIVALCLMGLAFYLDSIPQKGIVPDDEITPYSYEDEEESLIRYDGKWYKPKASVDTFLLIGVDSYGDNLSDPQFFLNDGRSDFISLIAVDHDKKAIETILINRDTMAEVMEIGSLGDRLGTRIMQLALAHTYGSGRGDSSENVCKAVSGLFFDLPIKKYFRITMDAINVINNDLGGVNVVIEDEEFSFGSGEEKKTFYRGDEVLLRGDMAESFVRARMSVGAGTNIERMGRQKTYLLAARDLAIEKLREDSSFALNVLSDISSYSCNNLSTEEVSMLSKAIEEYSFHDFIIPTGESKEGPEFMEFYPDQEDLQRLMIEIWYEETK